MTQKLPHSKLPDIGTTIFTTMSALAAQHQALNLSQGFPDFDAPLALRESLTRRVIDGHNQYAPMIGAPILREQIVAQLARYRGVECDPDTEITVVPGATEAIFCAIAACIHSGDEVIIFDPCYDSYAPSITLAGGRAVHLPLSPVPCPLSPVPWKLRHRLEPGTLGHYRTQPNDYHQFSAQPQRQHLVTRRSHRTGVPCGKIQSVDP